MSIIFRIDLVIKGKVQGVGFRYFTKKKADSLGITGCVKNNLDGSVYVTAQGEASSLESFTKFCYIGPPHSIVKSIKKMKKPVKRIEDFSITY